MADEFENALARVMFRQAGSEGGAANRAESEQAVVAGCHRLSGGASMESWAFDYAGEGYILRRAADAALMAGRPFGHATEAALVQAAHGAGVTAPEVMAVLTAEDGLGSGYIMRRIGGTAEPGTILRTADDVLIADIARELAAIHAVPVDAVPPIDAPTPRELLDRLHEQFDGFGADRPIIALALKWCEDNLPPPRQPSLVHGDFRMGNLMVEDGRLSGVLDWELAHLGDPHEDIAWGCVGAWRFGNYDQPAFGIATLEAYFAAYESASGMAVDRARFRYWLVHRTIWWALGCMQMGAIWREGSDRSLERAAIARRTVENEIDLLLLLDESDDAPVAVPEPTAVPQAGETSSAELLDAVGEWIAADVKPTAQGRNRFLSAVAINALKIAARDLRDPAPMTAPMTDAALCTDIRSGRTTLDTSGLRATLRLKALRKGMNDVPKYAGLAAAKEKWT
ncbi:MAG: phosphotransferase [Pontixanthobacter sp.]